MKINFYFNNKNNFRFEIQKSILFILIITDNTMKEKHLLTGMIVFQIFITIFSKQ